MAEHILDVPMRLALPRAEFVDLCRKYHVKELAVFGSALRDDFRPDSDVDFLVEFENDDAGPWMSRLTRLQEDLGKLLGRDVDVTERKAVEQSRNPFRRKAILSSMKLLMSPEERDPAYLWDMLDRARLVMGFVRGLSFDSYVEDAKSRYAVERALTVLVEAARRVSTSFKAQHPEISWSDLFGFRNLLTHDYEKLKQDRIWKIATKDVPELIRRLEVLVPESSD